MIDFIYPQEAVVDWGLLITIYPYITGLVAGAFIVSSLYHVFGIASLKPVARFSLISALAFLIASPLPLVIHLGRPERALEMFLRPNFVSAMAGFGYIWMFYLLLVLFEVWLVFRPDIVGYAQTSKGLMKRVYQGLSLGVTDLSEATLAVDRRLIRLLAIIGVPVACLLHGYVGFIFGAIKANAWWSTPLMPIIFLLSAIVSGIALLVVLYVVVTKIRREPLDKECLSTMSVWLGGFLTLALIMEGLEVVSMLYESEESWEMIRRLITERLGLSYFGLQFGMGAILPLLVLAGVHLGKIKGTLKSALIVGASASVLVGVFAMRWNVVVGGQIISKSLRGFTEYVPTWLGTSGLLMATALMLLPFVILAVMLFVIPPWERRLLETAPKAAAEQKRNFSFEATPVRGRYPS
jgi:Ni/Fe-hydrogenase subunit HybB-like protein